MQATRRAFLALLAAGLALAGWGPSCHKDDDDCNKDAFRPHRCGPTRTTPGGHEVCDTEHRSIVDGWLTAAKIDAAVDEVWGLFYAAFPEFYGLRARVEIHDDYVFWVGVWAAGYHPAGEPTVVVTLWTRTESPTEPSFDVPIKRPAGRLCGFTLPWRYGWWPILPGLAHELLHVAIEDPGHRDPRWARVPGGCVSCQREA